MSYPVMIRPDEALSLVLGHTSHTAVESIRLSEAAGRFLARPLCADRDYPPFDRAMMDGFAVSLRDRGRTCRVTAEVAAGDPLPEPLEPGCAVQIMTGAACPPGTNVVLPIEQAVMEGDLLRLPDDLIAGKHIARAGSECRAGQKLLQAGARLSPLAIANLATCGRAIAEVFALPKVTLISTGNELVDAAVTPQSTQIRDSTSPMLGAFLELAAVRYHTVQGAPDDPHALHAAVEEAASGSDVVIFTGGVSAGKHDYLPQALLEAGAEIVFHKVRQKPGKPLLLASLAGRLIFGLPGNPLSAHLGFHRYILAALRQMQGADPAPLTAQALLNEELTPDRRRTRFVLARWQDAEITPISCKGSADIYSVAGANAYLRIDPEDKSKEAGTLVRFELTGGV